MNCAGAPAQDDMDVIEYDESPVVLSEGGHCIP